MFSKFTIPLLILAAALVGAIPLCAITFSQATPDTSMGIFCGALTFLERVSLLAFFKRKPFLGVILGTLATAVLAGHYLAGSPWLILASVVFAFLFQAGLHDFLQPKHSLERAFP